MGMRMKYKQLEKNCDDLYKENMSLQKEYHRQRDLIESLELQLKYLKKENEDLKLVVEYIENKYNLAKELYDIDDKVIVKEIALRRINNNE